MRNDWYYWSKNQHAHFIVFRERDCQVVHAKVTPLGDDSFRWLITCDDESFRDRGNAGTLDEAKQAVDERVMAIIAIAFKPEYVPPLG